MHIFYNHLFIFFISFFILYFECPLLKADDENNVLSFMKSDDMVNLSKNYDSNLNIINESKEFQKRQANRSTNKIIKSKVKRTTPKIATRPRSKSTKKPTRKPTAKPTTKLIKKSTTTPTTKTTTKTTTRRIIKTTTNVTGKVKTRVTTNSITKTTSKGPTKSPITTTTLQATTKALPNHLNELKKKTLKELNEFRLSCQLPMLEETVELTNLAQIIVEGIGSKDPLYPHKHKFSDLVYSAQKNQTFDPLKFWTSSLQKTIVDEYAASVSKHMIVNLLDKFYTHIGCGMREDDKFTRIVCRI